MKNRTSLTILFSVLLLILGCTHQAKAFPSMPTREVSETSSFLALPEWKKAKQLIEEQKYQEAEAQFNAIRQQAELKGDEALWTNALISQVQLHIALSGYETAVRFLKEQKWPQGIRWSAALHLFYAQAITTYVQQYSWEIGQREKTVTSTKVDLKAWTQDQLVAEALASYQHVWELREQFSRVSVDEFEFLSANTYPREIRGTLRDAISYLIVQILSDTSLWQPEESNDSYQQDVVGLLSNPSSKGVAMKIDDPKVHPLQKIVFVLADLEGWHQSQKESGAALEAHLARIQQLWTSFSESSDRLLIRKHLEQLLPAFRSISWWSMGKASLARMVDQGEHDLIQAHQIAQEGYEAYPESPGGKACLSLMKQIEVPDFSVSAMKSDSIGKRSIEVRYKNMRQIYFRAYELDLLRQTQEGGEDDIALGENWISNAKLLHLLKRQKPIAAWTEDIPKASDYQEHRAYITPPLKKIGGYLIVASAMPDFSDRDNHLVATSLLLSDLVLVQSKTENQTAEIRALWGQNGTPAAGVDVAIYRKSYQKAPIRLFQAKTDKNGSVSVTLKERNYDELVVAHQGEHWAVDSSRYTQSERRVDKYSSLIYTDRGIYRPGQKLFFKVVGYQVASKQLQPEILTQHPVTMRLLDTNNKEVAKVELTTNNFGSAAGEIVIPSGQLLGNWRLESSLGGNAYVKVEEYKRPTFEVTFRDTKEGLRLNHAVTFIGEAKYYFGLPVTQGKVRFKVTREPVFPWWEFFSHWSSSGSSSVTQVIASGSATVREDGTFSVPFLPKVDERQSKDVKYNYVISANFTDEGGETRSATKTVRLGFRNIEAKVTMEPGFFVPTEEGIFSVSRLNLDGIPIPGRGQWKVFSVKQPKAVSMPADLPMMEPNPSKSGTVFTSQDRLRPRWETEYQPNFIMASWPEEKQFAQGMVTHNAKGEALVKLPRLAAGVYRFHYETQDEFGQVCKVWKDFVVADSANQIALPVQLVAQQSSVSVGGTARILVASGFPEQTMYLDVFVGEKHVERRQLTASQQNFLEFPITEASRGGFWVTLSMLRDHQWIRLSQSIHVPWDNKELQVEFATFRDKIKPGAHETWRVVIKDKKGVPAIAHAAEVLAYMYDKSLDLFGSPNLPSVSSLFPMGASGPWWSLDDTSLGRNQGETIYLENNSWGNFPSGPSLNADHLRFLEDYGIGGMGRYGLFAMDGTTSRAMPPSPPNPAPMEMPQKMKAGLMGDMDGANKKEPNSATLEAETGDSIPPTQQLRQNFSETAFFKPQLLTDEKGTVTLEFTAPDSVTAWNLWIHAMTKDLASGSLRKEVKTVKELMVRPYLPRFFREGDQAELQVMVNNAGEKPLSGTLELQVLDPETQKNANAIFGIKTPNQAFQVEPGKSKTLTFAVTVPKQVGLYAVKVEAKAGSIGDGELRSVPVLPSRMHLTQSRFVTLRNADQRTLRFEDLKQDNDPSRINEQLVVNVDAQLFFTVLKAVPYLVYFPHECVEQTLNRFLSAGILSSVFQANPSLTKLAKEFSQRNTALEGFDAPDPNRKLLMEETPWVQESKGGTSDEKKWFRLLDPKVAKAQRDTALQKLQKIQSPDGGFPWFSGGPASPYMTLYLMYGFAKASEFGIEVPKDMVQKGWRYLVQYARKEYFVDLKKVIDWEFLTFLNYVASAYPDPSWMGEGALTAAERKQILDYSFVNWKQHSPYLKGFLALTLKRMGRPKDAKLVFDSVMDSAKTEPDQGTFWQPEDRSWLWYNDTIESHAFALRVLMEIDPQNPKKDGLVLWLLLNKKLNQWKSTKATAEVIYALVHYLKKDQSLGIREEATVTAGDHKQTFIFEPDAYVGKSQWVLPGAEVNAKTGEIQISKPTKGLMFASATWSFSTDKLPDEERGNFFQVSRKYFKREMRAKENVLLPLQDGARLMPGDEVEVQLQIRSKHAAEYVHLSDPRAAGFEPEQTNSGYHYDLGIGFYEEIRDNGTNFFIEQLPQGEYTLKYRIRANLAGTFRVGPATLQSMYAPEFNAYSKGHILRVYGQ